MLKPKAVAHGYEFLLHRWADGHALVAPVEPGEVFLFAGGENFYFSRRRRRRAQRSENITSRFFKGVGTQKRFRIDGDKEMTQVCRASSLRCRQYQSAFS